MCAEIAACSGGQGKRGPSQIWDAPIDAWAATAADIATDFVPGVAQAKTAYDAYDRIQNGEDPVDVLMAAGADAALGLIPGLEAGKKIDKALDKAEDVADAAGDVGRNALTERAGPTGHISPTKWSARPRPRSTGEHRNSGCPIPHMATALTSTLRPEDRGSCLIRMQHLLMDT